MKSSLKLITIRGISVYIHFTFYFLVLWLLVIDIASGMKLSQVLWSMLFLVAIFVCITLHEYGHAIVASQFGINARKITLYPIGGIASLEKLPDHPKQELLISIAGPAVSFTIAALMFLFAPQKISAGLFKNYTNIIDSTNIVYSIGVFNLILGLFNLIPAFPMDGGRIFRALLAFKLNYIKATAIAASVGKVIAGLFIIAGLVTMNILLMVIGVFIILFANAEESYLRLKSLVHGLRLKEVLMNDYESIDGRMKVNEAANILDSHHSKYFIVMEDGKPIGTLNRLEVIKAVSEQNYEQPIHELMKENLEHLEGEMEVEDIMEKLAGNEEKIFPVFNKEEFIGVVNFQHIIEYLLLHKVFTKEYHKARSLAELV
jgi:Zn-dependent protease/predicted transcriptional regulator